MTETTVEQVRRTRLAQSGPQPLLTHYDLSTGERVELSHVTTDNWVAKTAALMADEGIGVGDRVRLELPCHWQAAVWCLAAWSVGASVVDDEEGLLVSAADTATESDSTQFVCSLRPLGLPCEGPLPAGALDYALEVRSQPDQFSAASPPPHQLAIALDDRELTQAEVVERARSDSTSRQLGEGARILLHEGTIDELTGALAAALACGGSLVIVRAALAASSIEMVTAEERVTHQW